jgi:hypothetical protein
VEIFSDRKEGFTTEAQRRGENGREKRTIGDFLCFCVVKGFSCRNLSAPLIHTLPPDQAQPFIYKGLRPLAVSPPSHAKLCLVSGRGDRVLVSRNFSPENAQRAPRVEIRGHDQHTPTARARDTLLRIFRLVLGGQSLNRTHADRCCLRQILRVLLRQLKLREFVDFRMRRDIQYNATPVSLREKLQSPLRTPVRFPRQHQDHVRGPRRVQHKEATSLRGRQYH